MPCHIITEYQRSGELGRRTPAFYKGIRPDQLFVLCRVRGTDVFGILGAPLAHCEIGSFEVHAGKTGAEEVFLVGQAVGFEGIDEFAPAAGKGRRHQGSGTVTGMELRDLQEGFRGVIHEIVPCPAVYVDVDKPRTYVPSLSVDVHGVRNGYRPIVNSDYLSVVDDQLSVGQGLAGEKQLPVCNIDHCNASFRASVVV